LSPKTRFISVAIGLLLVLPGCGQQAALPDADGELRAAELRLTLTLLQAAPPDSDLQPRFKVNVYEARRGRGQRPARALERQRLVTLRGGRGQRPARALERQRLVTLRGGRGQRPARVLERQRLVTLEATGAWALPGRAIALVTPEGELRVWRPGARQRSIDRHVVGPISASPGGRLLAYTRRPTAGGALWLAEVSSGRRWRLGGRGAACLPLFSADGARIAFVDTSPEGIASLFVASLGKASARAPRQLTNRGVRRRPGQAPAGFVPPPGPGALRWQGGSLRWHAAGRSWSVPVDQGGR
jgi:hypothetical protein